MDLSQGQILPSKEELDHGPIVLMCSLDDLKQYYPVISPWLQKGSETDPSFDAVAETERIFTGETQIWVAVLKGRIRGAFATSVLHDGEHEGELCLDIHSLAGEKFKDWSHEMARMLREWAKYNSCHRIIWRARSMASTRLYKPIGDIQHLGKCPKGTGHEYFEVRI